MIRSLVLGAMMLVLATVALTSTLPATANAMSQGKGSRVIPRSETPIANQLSGDDEEVRVEEFAIVHPVRLNDDELIRLRVESAASIVVARVTAAKGELTEDGTWVQTRLRGVIEQVIKGAADTVRQPFDAYLHGGEIRIGKVRVQAGDIPVLHTGEAYLIFVGERAEPDAVPMVEWVHQLARDGRLQTLEAHRAPANAAAFGKRRNPFENRSLKDVISILQKYLR